MRKLLTCLCALLLLGGCSKKDSVTSEQLKAYHAYYKSVLDNDTYNQSSKFFSIQAVMNKIDDTHYRYYIILDNPQIALYDVEMLVVENDTNFTDTDKMAPSVGIFENQEYALIPYQVYTEEGYVKGLIASGEISEPKANLKVMVTWKDYAKLKQSREFFEFKTDYDKQEQDEAARKAAEAEAQKNAQQPEKTPADSE